MATKIQNGRHKLRWRQMDFSLKIDWNGTFQANFQLFKSLLNFNPEIQDGVKYKNGALNLLLLQMANF
jgi:hypothetical protein